MEAIDGKFYLGIHNKYDLSTSRVGIYVEGKGLLTCEKDIEHFGQYVPIPEEYTKKEGAVPSMQFKELLKDYKRVKEDKILTEDNCLLSVGDTYYMVNSDYQFITKKFKGSPSSIEFVRGVLTGFPKDRKVFKNKDRAVDYVRENREYSPKDFLAGQRVILFNNSISIGKEDKEFLVYSVSSHLGISDIYYQIKIKDGDSYSTFILNNLILQKDIVITNLF